MAVKDVRETEGANLGDGGLEEHIAHWAEVLDRWVQSIDARLGRSDGGDPAAPPDEALRLYEYFLSRARLSDISVEQGEFGAAMKLALVNDGPVTIIVDSRVR